MTTMTRRQQRQGQRRQQALGATWERTRQHRSANGQQRKVNAVDANVDVDISVSQLLHWDITATTGNAVALAVGRHDKSGQRKAQQERSEQGGGRGNNGGGGKTT